MRFRLNRWVDQSEWHQVFAWWPRRIDDHLVWLETVERRVRYDNWAAKEYEYRLYDPPSDGWAGY